jgi:hypothetical protein
VLLIDIDMKMLVDGEQRVHGEHEQAWERHQEALFLQGGHRCYQRLCRCMCAPEHRNAAKDPPQKTSARRFLTEFLRGFALCKTNNKHNVSHHHLAGMMMHSAAYTTSGIKQ